MAPGTLSYPISRIMAFDPMGEMALQFNQVEGVAKE
jgi:hypothetical protein